MDFFLKINKRACTTIRYTRVPDFDYFLIPSISCHDFSNYLTLMSVWACKRGYFWMMGGSFLTNELSSGRLSRENRIDSRTLARYSLIVSLISEATPSTIQFFKWPYDISHPP